MPVSARLPVRPPPPWILDLTLAHDDFAHGYIHLTKMQLRLLPLDVHQNCKSMSVTTAGAAAGIP